MATKTTNDLSLVVLPGPRELSIIEGEVDPDAHEEEGQSKEEEPVPSAVAAVHPFLEFDPVFFRPLLGLDQVGLDPVFSLLNILVVHVALDPVSSLPNILVVHVDQTLRSGEELNKRTSCLGDL